jgi:hypothetical protein
MFLGYYDWMAPPIGIHLFSFPITKRSVFTNSDQPQWPRDKARTEFDGSNTGMVYSTSDKADGLIPSPKNSTVFVKVDPFRSYLWTLMGQTTYFVEAEVEH